MKKITGLNMMVMAVCLLASTFFIPADNKIGSILHMFLIIVHVLVVFLLGAVFLFKKNDDLY